MRFLAFLLLCLPSFGATCASLNLLDKASLTFDLPSYGPRSNSQLVTITNNAGNAYTVTDGAKTVIFNSVPSKSGTGNDFLWAYVYGAYDAVVPINGQTDTVNFTINGTACTLPITYNVLTAANRNAPLRNALGIADSALPSCSSPGGAILGCSQIAASVIGSLPGGAAKLPANNATTTIPEFGEVIKHCDGDLGIAIHIYSSMDSLNADDSIIFEGGPAGGQYLVDTATCTAHAVTLTGKNFSSDPIFWDHTCVRSNCQFGAHIGDPTKFWYYCGNQICQGVVNTGTWAVTITQPKTFSGATLIVNGGTDDTAEDNWFVFTTDRDHAGSTSHPNLCQVEPYYSPTPYAEHCRDYTQDCGTCLTNGINNAIQSRGVSPFSNKRFAIIQDNVLNTGYHYSLTTGATNLVFESNFGLDPEFPGGVPSAAAWNRVSMVCTGADALVQNRCLSGNGHAHTVQDAAGHQYWINGVGQATNEPFVAGQYAVDLDSCQASNQQLCTLPVANGGGLSIVTWADITSGEVGCVSGWCFITQVGGSVTGVTSYQINQAATSGGNIVLTLNTAPGSGLVTNDVAYVGGVGANCANANGAWAANQITVSGTSVTLPGKTCTSTVTGSGAIYKNVYPATANYRQEIVGLKYANNAVTQYYRPGVTLSSDFSADRVNGNYWMKVGCAPSHDLKYLVCNTNDGVPETSHVILISLGLNASGISSSVSGKNVFGGKATIQ